MSLHFQLKRRRKICCHPILFCCVTSCRTSMWYFAGSSLSVSLPLSSQPVTPSIRASCNAGRVERDRHLSWIALIVHSCHVYRGGDRQRMICWYSTVVAGNVKLFYTRVPVHCNRAPYDLCHMYWYLYSTVLHSSPRFEVCCDGQTRTKIDVMLVDCTL